MSVERIRQLLAEMDAEAHSPAGFTGVPSPEELYAARHRAHSPFLGRWLQNDPVAYVKGENRYTFVHGSPGDDQ